MVCQCVPAAGILFIISSLLLEYIGLRLINTALLLGLLFERCSYELKEENGKKGEEKLLVLLSGVDPPQLFTERSCLRSPLQGEDDH